VTLGDPNFPMTVSSTAFDGVPPENGKKTAVLVAKALDVEEQRQLVQQLLPEITGLETLPIRLIKGPFAAKTVEEAFEMSKAGASGEKIVIEWTD
jgi:hypothetical protein